MTNLSFLLHEAASGRTSSNDTPRAFLKLIWTGLRQSVPYNIEAILMARDLARRAGIVRE
jgi:hypothetical protein